ncbi:MAG: UDP-2,3-diacylglucosamine diphosphatase [Thiotrichales bacterium]
MPATTKFISDLHLDQSRPEIVGLFLQFLQEQQDTKALYILGDLFEYWIGDDQPITALEPLIKALQKLTSNGVPVYFIAGNRDFLIGSQFAQATGITLLPDMKVIDLYGRRALIMHGDTLCTDDLPYQQLRTMLRDPAWQQQFLSLPLAERIEQARQLREKSQTETSDKDASIMDVNQQTVESVMTAHKVDLLIHGHTHRPAVHDFMLGAKSARRIVLGDWYEQGSVLNAAGQRLELQNLPK